MSNLVIKINWLTDVYFDDEIWKLKDTNLPLNGKYKDKKGIIRYFKNGKYHNENGPAYINTITGHKRYSINGKRHRIDGPAAILPDPEVYSWYVNGYIINSETIENWLTENDIPLDWNIWSNEDKKKFATHWSNYMA